jgi:hypothetical protein
MKPTTSSKKHLSNTLQQSKLVTPVSYKNTSINSLDLDLDHYSLEDICNLFNIDDVNLSEETLKKAKQIVLKMHPDKSRLDAKYFLFFSKAYKCLYGIYEFQNKSTNKQVNNEEFYDESNKDTLNYMFAQNKALKDPKNFNLWFNKTFEKHRLEDPNEQGYGDWFKSNEGIMNINETVTKGNMNEVFEKQKKHIQSLTIYNGVNDMVTSNLGGSMLDGNGDLTTNNYTDLRQAYTETLFPVTQEDYNNNQQFTTFSEYRAHRDKVDITPISEKDGEHKLLMNKQLHSQQSAALAFKYAKESEKVKEKQRGFWADIKQITGW